MPFPYLFLFLVYGTTLAVIPPPKWFPTTQGWTPLLPSPSPSTLFSSWKPLEQPHCTKLLSDKENFLDFSSTSPRTLIITAGQTAVTLHLEFIDEAFLFDQVIPPRKTLVVPPYKPLSWVLLEGTPSIVCSYWESDNDLNSTVSKCSEECANLDWKEAEVATYPRKLNKPTAEFFLSASYIPDENDLTITTILTPDRLINLEQLSLTYQGPISAATYVKDATEVEMVIKSWIENPSMRLYVDVHLVFDDQIFPYKIKTGERLIPINVLRNIAVQYSRTPYVFYVEVDFIPNLEFRSYAASVVGKLKENPRSIFLVAAFATELPRFSTESFDISSWPKTKRDLIGFSTFNRNNISGGFIPIDLIDANYKGFPFQKWIDSDEFLPVKDKIDGFTPYYIGRRDYPEFDPLVAGCDKSLHFSELALAGFDMFIFPTGYIVRLNSTGLGSTWCSDLSWSFPVTKGFSHRLRKRYSTEKLPRLVWWDEGNFQHVATAKKDIKSSKTSEDLSSVLAKKDDKKENFELEKLKNQLLAQLDIERSNVKFLVLQTMATLVTLLGATYWCTRKYGKKLTDRLY